MSTRPVIKSDSLDPKQIEPGMWLVECVDMKGTSLPLFNQRPGGIGLELVVGHKYEALPPKFGTPVPPIEPFLQVTLPGAGAGRRNRVCVEHGSAMFMSDVRTYVAPIGDADNECGQLVCPACQSFTIRQLYRITATDWVPLEELPKEIPAHFAETRYECARCKALHASEGSLLQKRILGMFAVAIPVDAPSEPVLWLALTDVREDILKDLDELMGSMWAEDVLPDDVDSKLFVRLTEALAKRPAQARAIISGIVNNGV